MISNMRYTVLFLFILFFTDSTFAQSDSLVVSPDYLSKLPVSNINRFDESRKSDYILYFPMSYAEFIFTDVNKKLLEDISDTIVERIDLIYTVFVQEKKFDQIGLNRERFEMLRKYFPEAFKSNLIEWKLIAQEGAKDLKAANNYFHGFVIYIKPHRVSTKEGEIINTVMDRRVDDPASKVLTTNEEIEKVKTIVNSYKQAVPTKIIKEKIVKWEDQKQWTGYYLHADPEKRKNGKRFEEPAKGRPKQYVTKRVKTETIIEKEIPDPDASIESKPAKELISKITNDSVVLKTLNSNGIRWKDYVFVQDLTGSMYPYLTQTLMYLKDNLDSLHPRNFVFFNDGNQSPDGPIGNTGGTYFIRSSKYSDIEKKAFDCMLAGKGGKAPENDLEAVMYAFRKSPEAKGAVLIADNFSPVRDLTLLKKIAEGNKPVDIVICGTPKNGDVHIHYLYIARITGGRVLTLNDSYIDLKNRKEGEIFNIGSQVFKIEGSRIKLMEQKGW